MKLWTITKGVRKSERMEARQKRPYRKNQCPAVLSNAWQCLALPTNAYQCLAVPTNAYQCLAVPTKAWQYLQKDKEKEKEKKKEIKKEKKREREKIGILTHTLFLLPV